jgi:hypothetical protein
MEKSYRKSVYLIALFFAFAFGTANAQQPPPGMGGPGDGAGFTRLIDELMLDDTQADEILAIFEASRILHEEERAVCQENMETLRDETHEAIMLWLDDDQQARFEELIALRAERWSGGERQGRGGRKGAGGNEAGGAGSDGNGAGGNGGGGKETGECTNPVGTNPDCPKR